MAETIRLEEFTGLIQNRIVCVWQNDVSVPFIPTEFLLTQYITRILVVGRSSTLSTALSSDPTWTQVWRCPGGKEWSCLLGILQHMPGPVLIILSPDVALSPKLIENLRNTGANATFVILRQGSGGGFVATDTDTVFFPVIDRERDRTLVGALSEMAGRTNQKPRGLDIKGLLPQLAAQGYGLTVADGIWSWYKPADSPPLATLTVQQIARQIQILGNMLERTIL
jgi:hypothetical protein